jgi:hypothetical protein
MSLALRAAAVLIAIAAAIDPVFTRSSSIRPLVQIIVPAPTHPEHERALALRAQVIEQLADVARFDEVERPRARLLIGEPTGPIETSQPVYALPLDRGGVVIQQLRAPEQAGAGQQIQVEAVFRARPRARTPSEIGLGLNGVRIASQQYEWTEDNEAHTARFVVPGQPPGVHTVRVTVATGGETAHADTVVAVTGRPLRVLVYEARPSWPAAFARRMLEDDPRFEVAAVARSTPQVATISGGAAPRLTAERLGGYDALILGGLDALSASDLDAVAPFVSTRGGSVVLLPDRQVPASLLTRLRLPLLEEVLLEDSAAITSGSLTFRASELLLPQAPHLVHPLAGTPRAARSHPVVFVSPLGAGDIIFSGALDAWRYRGDEEQALRRFLRSVVADAAAAAPPPVDVSVTPALVRPGEPVTVTARVRETEWVRDGDTVILPTVSASVTDEDGERRMVRLWPTSRRGELAGVFTAPRLGRHQVAVTAGPARSDAVLVVADGVVHAAGAHETVRSLAVLSGGAVVEDLTRAKAALASLDEATTTRQVRPMRSAWWIVPFAACLGAEWTLRRRAGLR